MADVMEIQLDTKQSSPGRSHRADAEFTGKYDNVIDDAVPERYRGSDQDKHDMIVHGNRQETRRNFKLLTMTGFASMVVCAWEGLLPLFNYVLIDGGTALMFWGFIAVAISMSMVYLSIAEMASMYSF
jgi:choline transport protein